MNIEELYDETYTEYKIATTEGKENHKQAALALRAFILLLIERGSIQWQDDTSVLTEINRKIDASSEQVKARTNQMIFEKIFE